MEFEWAIGATILVSILSLVGVISLVWSKEKLKKWSIRLVAISAGTLLAGAGLHLIPEAVAEAGWLKSGLGVAMGLILFFIMERGLKWRHCHEGENCPKHHFAWLNLTGDGIHNLIDGIIIGEAFRISRETGIITTVMIILHEIPQEIGDFGILIYSGLSRVKALVLNLLIGLTAVMGAIISAQIDEKYLPWLVAITAGGFIYIGAIDLLPELKNKKTNWGWFGLGAGWMIIGKIFE